jgi:hypothetical protein
MLPLSDGWTRPPHTVVMRTVLDDRAPAGILIDPRRNRDDPEVPVGDDGHQNR